MAFKVFVDGSANLPEKMLDGITVLPCEYFVDETSHTYLGNVDQFDGHAYYEDLRNGKVVKTTLLNTQLFLSSFIPVLKEGMDIIYVSMSSGISGTYNAAVLAARELLEQFEDRYIHVVDSLGCGFGSGMLAYYAAELSRRGRTAKQAARLLERAVPHMCQYFTVDDLSFLRRSGRLSMVAAKVGTILNTKPILYGDKTGHIVSCGIVRGRKKAVAALLDKYKTKRTKGSSHGDCPEDAEQLAAGIREVSPDANITICQHEPFSGAHVGPGMLGLFFHGTER